MCLRRDRFINAHKSKMAQVPSQEPKEGKGKITSPQILQMNQNSQIKCAYEYL